MENIVFEHGRVRKTCQVVNKKRAQKHMINKGCIDYRVEITKGVHA